MADLDRKRRTPDLLLLLCGLVALAVATTAIAGTAWLPPVDARWLLAGAAVTIGLALLVSSLRPGRH